MEKSLAPRMLTGRSDAFARHQPVRRTLYSRRADIPSLSSRMRPTVRSITTELGDDMSALSEMSVSRRRFVEAMGAATMATAFGMVGCTSQRASEAGSSTGATATGSTDTITFSQGAEPRGLDPAYVDDGESAKIMCNIYETLLRYADDSCDLLPGLASDYTVSDDGLTYVFTLEEGVTFQDGTDFNADAVVTNIERQLEPNCTEDMPYASFVYGSEADGNGVESVEATGDYEVTITMRSASTPFLKNLAMALASPIVSPKAIEDNNGNVNEHPVGTGPYEFVSWSRNQNVVLKAYDKYWNSERAAKTPNIIFVCGHPARVAVYRAHRSHVAAGRGHGPVPYRHAFLG
ncbi:hypothetical protein B5F33_00580 [Collinsella sp. An2]|nr:hypothetical protein B5F33_00580 [Collinsella sp. An2]